MAQDLSPYIPKLLAQGLLALRQNAFMARIVNTGYEKEAGEKGSTVTIPISSAITAADVTPAATPPSTSDTVATSTTLVLDQWKEAAFYLTDKDFLEVDRGVMPGQAAEAIKAIANVVDNAIFACYKDLYGYAGVAGTTPLATDTSEYLTARKVLNNQLAPMSPRFMVMGSDMEANALGLRAFTDASFSGNIDGIINGQINNKLGASWLMSQNVPTHTAGTGANYLVNNGAGYAAGIKTIAVDTGTGTMLAGDIITFAGSSQTYTVTSALAANSVSFEPGLVATLADNTAITLKASHTVNLLLHRDAIAFASRPFNGSDPMNLGKFMSAVDPVSGIALRLEVSREHKRTRFAYDILYGCKTVRRELGARVAG